MSFEKLFKADILGRDFNKARYLRSYKERANVSKAKLDTYSNVRYLKKDDHCAAKYSAVSTRYSSALALSYDLLVSFYNVDTRESLTCRTFMLGTEMKGVMEKYLQSMKRKNQDNIEARIVGMQSGQEFNYLYYISELINSKGVKLVEVDLFGTELRHIAFDTKLGTSLNVLVEDRLYRAGELRNGMTMEQFEASRAQATDV